MWQAVVLEEQVVVEQVHQVLMEHQEQITLVVEVVQ
tara:strand:+ start:602 stop:709 length:108 start_codon:yes stop_codon:yes gene_type:complete